MRLVESNPNPMPVVDLQAFLRAVRTMLQAEARWFPNLGGRSQGFTAQWVSEPDGQQSVRVGLEIKVVSTEKVKPLLSEAQIREVIHRWNGLDGSDRRKTSMYTDPEWRSSAGRIRAPYVAGLIRAYVENPDFGPVAPPQADERK